MQSYPQSKFLAVTHHLSKSALNPLALLAVLTLGLSTQSSHAAKSTEAGKATSNESLTASELSIDVEDLVFLIEPLTKQELEIEVKAWQKSLQSSILAISKAHIASRHKNEEIESDDENGHVSSKEQDEQNQLLNNLEELQEAKLSAIARLNTVLDAYEKKGGDPAEYRAYVSATSGINIQVGDATSSWAAITGWLKSDEGGGKLKSMALRFFGTLLSFWIIAEIASKAARKITAAQKNLTQLLKRFINKLTKRTILFIGILVALASIGFNVAALLTVIGGGAFIIGFALQDTLGNFASGMMLLFYRPFDVGDIVDVGGITGKVAHVSLVNTSILTFDNKVVLVPNTKVWGEVIINSTASSERRVDMIFGIGYADDLSKALAILEKVVASHDMVMSTPEPLIKVHELAESSVNIICRPWSKTDDYWDVYWDITRQVKEAFDAEGVSIPFPQQDIHIHKSP
jgi:small conductance mechanosensitive channel